MKRVIRVGSRESKLAMTQSRLVINEISKRHPELEIELIGMKTSGDIILDRNLNEIGGKGLFTKELEHALIKGNIDMAVHSMKDMPADLPEGLEISAVSKREDPRDVLISRDMKGLNELPEGAVMGTSSLRREIQLLEMRPDLKMKALRGNVLTRLDKLANNEYDGIILAAAGLKRLDLGCRCVHCFDVKELIPSAGQGILGIETREGDDVAYLMDSIHCEEAALCLMAERTYMKRLGGGCSTPVAAHAVIRGTVMEVYGMFADDNKYVYRAKVAGKAIDAEKLGLELVDEILVQLGRKN